MSPVIRGEIEKRAVERNEVKEEAVAKEEVKVTSKYTAKRRKTAEKKSTPAAKRSVVVVEYAGNQIDAEEVTKRALTSYFAQHVGAPQPKEFCVYIKAEENVAYYTVDGVGSDSFRVALW